MADVAGQVEAYIAFKQALGVKMTSAASALRQFARYAAEHGHVGPVDVDIAVAWASSGSGHSHGYEAVRYGYARRVAAFSRAFDKGLPELPEGLFGKGYLRVTPHVFSDEDVSLLAYAASRMEAADPLAPLSHAALIGILSATGMRPSEALGLADADIDLSAGTVLVNDSKGTTRLLPIGGGTVAALEEYLGRRESLRSGRSHGRLLLAASSKPLALHSAERAFECYRGILLGRGQLWEGRAPRLFDLRHTFAVKTILKWHAGGEDVGSMLPVLATYMGHAHIGQTYWYLTGAPELMEMAAAAFGALGACGEGPYEEAV